MSQPTLFDLLREMEARTSQSILSGSMDVDRIFRESVSEALKKCPLSRYQVAARMSELTGQEITKAMLDSWTAESKEQHRFPAIFVPAFCEAVSCTDPLRILGRPTGVFVLPGPEALRAEIQRLEEEITVKQQEKRKRVFFLKEMEGGRRSGSDGPSRD